MRNPPCRLWFVWGLALWTVSAIGWAADSADFSAARRTLLRQLKSKKAETRESAVRELADKPPADAVRLLVEVGLKHPQDDVREASYKTLMELKDDPEACSFLVDTLDKEEPKRGNPKQGQPELALPLLAVLLDSELEDSAVEVFEYLDERVAAGDEGVALVTTLADELGKRTDEQSLAALVRLRAWPGIKDSFAIRRAVAQNLARSRRPESIDHLIEMLTTAQGEVKADIVKHLTRITGEPHAGDASAWRQWWGANRETFQFPAEGDVAALNPFVMREAPRYYGLPLFAQRIVFVLDTSGSMEGPRLPAAQRELINAIGELQESTHFGIVVFNSHVAVWKKELVPATSENRALATEFVAKQRPQFTTASYDALEAALMFDAEAVYFLTDGAPHGGKTDSPVEIVEYISQLNRSRRLTINALGIDVGPPGSPFALFLRALADRNFGEFRSVDQ
jgi:hypothetical protein